MKTEKSTMTITRGFHIRIPKQVRDELKLKPGQKVQVFVFNDRIELIPVRSVESMRGFVRGMSTSVMREKDAVR